MAVSLREISALATAVHPELVSALGYRISASSLLGQVPRSNFADLLLRQLLMHFLRVRLGHEPTLEWLCTRLQLANWALRRSTGTKNLWLRATQSNGVATYPQAH